MLHARRALLRTSLLPNQRQPLVVMQQVFPPVERHCRSAWSTCRRDLRVHARPRRSTPARLRDTPKSRSSFRRHRCPSRTDSSRSFPAGTESEDHLAAGVPLQRAIGVRKDEFETIVSHRLQLSTAVVAIEGFMRRLGPLLGQTSTAECPCRRSCDWEVRHRSFRRPWARCRSYCKACHISSQPGSFPSTT